MEIDWDDVRDGSEFATLACRWPRPADAVETVHLKVTFGDAEPCAAGTAVMRACAVVAGDARTDASGVYEGVVSADEASEASRRPGDESVSVWLRDARAALTDGRVGDDCGKRGAAVYERCVRRWPDEDGAGTVILSWKLKHELCTVALGSVRLSRVAVPPGPVARTGVEFVGPLIGRLLAERRRRDRVTAAASATAGRLLADNRQLLDRLKSMAESRQRDDRRTAARFLEILNKKKLRIAEMQRELGELKRQLPTVKVEEKQLTTKGRRGTGTGRGGCEKNEFNHGVKDRQSDDNGTVFEKQRTDRTAGQKSKPTSMDVGVSVGTAVDKKEVVDVSENITVDPFEAAASGQISMAVQNSKPMLMDVDVSAASAVGIKEVVDVPENITVDPFEAATQVDPISDDSPVSLSPESPPWLQQTSTMEPQLQSSPIRLQMQSSSTQPQTQSSSTQPQMQSSSLQQPSEQKSVLDSLWYGIV